jgi:chromosomal replication initiator protein
MPQPSDINTRIGQRLAETVGQRRYEVWIQPSVHLDYRGGDTLLHVAVPNRFVADKIRRDFSQELRDAARHAAGVDADAQLHLELSIEPDRFTPKTPHPPSTHHPTPPSDPPKRRDGHPAAPAAFTTSLTQTPARKPPALRHRLEDFVVGPSNELALAAAAALAEADPDAPRGTSTHTLFLHGECGLGKTHLLQGVCRRVLERHPRARVHYTTAEAFTNAYITAVRQNKLDAFRKQMRRLDLLAVDDVSFFANKEKTQQELQHCLDHIDLSGSRVILASDSHPRLIRSFSEALVSRCVQGLVVQVHPPDTATRLALVHRLAKQRGLVLPPGLDERLAAHAGRSVRELEGTLAQVHALTCLAQPTGPSRLVPRTVIEQLTAGQDPRTPRRAVGLGEIRTAVCGRFHVTAEQIAGSSRHRTVVLARALLIHLARQLTTLSFPEIAAALGKSSHSTVVTAGQRMARQLEANQPLLLPGHPEPLTPVQLVEDLRRQVLHNAV